MIDIDLYLDRKKEKVNEALNLILDGTGAGAVAEAVRYSVIAGGKRLRPILALATAETLEAEEEAVIHVACALEFIHTYSLIHDDLPAMDDSDLRRGRPTCHRVYGEAAAILAGDALLTLAFETLSVYGMKEGYAERSLRIINELSEAAGVKGMIGGQALDLEAEGEQPTPAVVEEIASKKTGALLKAAVRCGAIAADASAPELETLTKYALSLGTAYQIVDDLLDREGTTAELGKPAGADSGKSKATYPAALGSKEARIKAEKLYGEAVSALQDLGRPTELLTALAGKLVFRTK